MTNAEDKIVQGRELMSLGRYEAAKEAFSDAVAMDRRNCEAYINLGNSCLALNQVDEGIAAFKKALMLEENNTEVLYSLGCAYFVAGDVVNSIKQFNRVEELGDATVEMYEIMTVMYAQSDDASMAIRCVNRAIQLAPLNVTLRVDKAQIYVALGRYREAIAVLHEIQELMPDDLEGYTVEVEVLLETEDYDAAIQAVDRALDRFPEDAKLYLLKARVLNTVGRYEEALEASRRALEGNPGESQIKSDVAIQVGIALAGMGKMDDSIRTIESAVGDAHSIDEAYFLVLNEALALQSYAKAEEYANKLLEIEDLEPRYYAEAIFARPFAMEKLGRVEEAKELYREAAVELRRTTIANPGLVEAYGYRVLCYKALGEYEEALELADHIIALDETVAASYAMKRDVLLAMGDVQGAQTLRAKILTLDPDFDFGEE